jgi:hypothetical protein
VALCLGIWLVVGWGCTLDIAASTPCIGVDKIKIAIKNWKQYKKHDKEIETIQKGRLNFRIFTRWWQPQEVTSLK